VKIIGLTGGIASGKSTVRGMLEAHGARVIDADAIYHGLIAAKNGEPSPLARQISARFPGVLTPEGNIDRRRLGEWVYGDAIERRALEAIAHPLVAIEVGRQIEALRTEGCPLALYDVPLLYERRLETGMDGVIVVWVPRDLQIRRLANRDRLSPREAERRLAAQLPLDEKRRLATWVVDNSGDLTATRNQVDVIWTEISG
jgi:dephospho-CoA kinase